MPSHTEPFWGSGRFDVHLSRNHTRKVRHLCVCEHGGCCQSSCESPRVGRAIIDLRVPQARCDQRWVEGWRLRTVG